MDCHMKREFAMRVCSMQIVSIMPCMIAQSMKLPDFMLMIYLGELILCLI